MPLATRAQEASPPTAGPQFAPGVLTVIAPDVDASDSLRVHDVVEIRVQADLQWEPSKWLTWEGATTAPTNRTLFEMAENAAFLQDVWCLELAFKPLRMIEVDVPQPSGRYQRKQIWYMVYRVRNTGAGLTTEVEADGEFATAPQGAEPLSFMAQFVLVSKDDDGTPGAMRKAYLDRVIPAAMPAIERREFGGRSLLNSVEMASVELPIEQGRTERGAWGVAMWEDLDPEIDFFSIYVGGLTNANQWEDPPGALQAGDPPGKGRRFTRKMLQLNFWRPGDAIDADEREIRFGAAPGEGARYDAAEGVAYQWIYR